MPELPVSHNYTVSTVCETVLYVVNTWAQWRMLPPDFAPWQTVYVSERTGPPEEMFDTYQATVRPLFFGQEPTDAMLEQAMMEVAEEAREGNKKAPE